MALSVLEMKAKRSGEQDFTNVSVGSLVCVLVCVHACMFLLATETWSGTGLRLGKLCLTEPRPQPHNGGF